MSDPVSAAADPLTHWTVEAVLSGLLLVLGFLARKAFADLSDALKGFTAQLAALQTTVNSHHTEVAVLRSDVNRLQAAERSFSDRILDLERARIHSSESGIRRE